MRSHLLPLSGALLVVLAACSDGEPQKIAKPAPEPVAPAPLVNHLTDIDPAAAGSDAKVTEGDKQKTASPAAKTGLLNPEPTPVAGGGTAVNPATGLPTVEAPLLPDRDAATKAEAQTLATDNSGKNARDDGSLPTPLDQGGGEADQTITQGIRQVVSEQPSLSVNAKNVKIITQDGVVTLRGPVADAREREAVYAIAVAQPGAKAVNNLLEPIQK